MWFYDVDNRLLHGDARRSTEIHKGFLVVDNPCKDFTPTLSKVEGGAALTPKQQPQLALRKQV